MTDLSASEATENTIFVQIASYRDSQLIPTLLDLIEKSSRPELLRAVVCWQHGPEETLGEFWKQGFGAWHFDTVDGRMVHALTHSGAKIVLIDVPHLQTQGACWARNLIQQHYGGERYTLQLDSHHRFVAEWDRRLIDMLESLRAESPKPVLTAYLPSFNPDNDPAARTNYPALLAFGRFSPEGTVFFHAKPFPDRLIRERPVPARFYSAHFAFADGHFTEAVQHDPFYFFHGEEISIAVRAFTHGYDLYHPHRLIAWHEYMRKYRPKMWNDHTREAKNAGDVPLHWVERNDASHQRNRVLFGMDGHAPSQIDFGKYGFGSARTLTQYEVFAGISFAHRGVQQATLDNVPPTLNTPLPASEATWTASLLRSNDVRICQHRNVFDEHALSPATLGVLSSAAAANAVVCDDSGVAIYHTTLNAQALTERINGDWLDIHLIFESRLNQVPAGYVVELLDDAGGPLARVKQPIQT